MPCKCSLTARRVAVPSYRFVGLPLPQIEPLSVMYGMPAKHFALSNFYNFVPGNCRKKSIGVYPKVCVGLVKARQWLL